MMGSEGPGEGWAGGRQPCAQDSYSSPIPKDSPVRPGGKVTDDPARKDHDSGNSLIDQLDDRF